MHAEIERRLGRSFERAELLRLQAGAFAPRPAMLQLASEVAMHAQVGMLTNNSALLELALPVRFPELCAPFESEAQLRAALMEEGLVANGQG